MSSQKLRIPGATKAQFFAGIRRVVRGKVPRTAAGAGCLRAEGEQKRGARCGAGRRASWQVHSLHVFKVDCHTITWGKGALQVTPNTLLLEVIYSHYGCF